MTRVKKKKRHHVRVIAIGIFLSFIVAILVGLIYLRVEGFKEALIELVDSSTGGRFVLEIQKTEIDYLELDFILSDVVMRKSSDSVSSELEQIHIPFIEVNLGPLVGVIAGGQFELEHFIIAEPIATISQKEISETTENDQPVNFAHEIAMFYPGIKAILDHFNIHDFRIQRGGINLQKPQKDIQFKLIDLLVSEWNMKDLSDEAGMHFRAGEQQISLNQSSFGFEEISFDYGTGELRIDNYSFEQVDSLGRQVVSVEGAAVIIDKLDYDALMDERYILEEIIIQNPRVSAYFYAHEKKEGASRQPISDLLKKNLGELVLRGGRIDNAHVSLFGYKNEDTLQIILPELDFETTNLVVTEDSSSLMMERFKLNVTSTDLDLGNDLGIQFSDLNYDEGYNLTINDITITDLDNGEELIQSSRIDMFLFNIFDYIYNKDLTADSVLIQNGTVLFDEDPSKFGNDGTQSPKKEPTQIHVSKIRLDNIDVFYNLAGKKIEIADLNAVVENIRSEDALSYDLRSLQTPGVVYKDETNDLTAAINALYLDPGFLEIGTVRAQKNDLIIEAAQVAGRLEDFNATEPLSSHWQSLSISSVNASGALPKTGKQQEEKEKNGPSMKLDRIRIDKVNVSLDLSDSSSVNMTDAQINISGLTLDSGNPSFETVNFTTPGVNFTTSSVNLSTGPISLQNRDISSIDELIIKTNKNDSLHIARIEIDQIVEHDSAWGLNEVTIKNIGFAQAGNKFSTEADSLKLHNAMIHNGSLPYFSEIYVFGTEVAARENSEDPEESISDTNNKTGSNSIELSQLFGKATVYPGSYALKDMHITYGQIDINTAPGSKHIDIHDLAFETRTAGFSVERVETIDEDLRITSLHIDPKQTYKPETETDIVGGRIDQLLFREVSWEELFRENNFIASSLEIGGFNLSLERDKTLPDPPPTQKTHLLTELIPLSKNFRLHQIHVTNGNLTYLETGDKTGQQGRIRLDSINFTMNLMKPVEEPEFVLNGNARLYGQGNMYFNYARLDSQRFDLEVRLLDFPVDSLNLMIDPLESVKLKSGYIREYDLSVRADSIQAIGQSLITYDDLHIEIFKRHEPDVRNFGSQLLTLLADGVVLKHSKTDALGNFTQERITFKGPINYWVKCAVHGAMTAIRKGKNERNVAD